MKVRKKRSLVVLVVTALGVAGSWMMLSAGEPVFDLDSGLPALGSAENVRNAYQDWVSSHETRGGKRNLIVPLGWSKAMSSEVTSARGKATLDLRGGRATVEVRGLEDGGSFEAWLVDNVSRPGDTVAPEPGDAFIRLGSLKPRDGVAKLDADLGSGAFDSFDVDLVVVARGGEEPVKAGVLFG